MDGVHDVGGMHGFGPVEREADEPTFHARWEADSRGCGRVVAGAAIVGMVGPVTWENRAPWQTPRARPWAYEELLLGANGDGPERLHRDSSYDADLRGQ